ncbi:coiled-coil domain-containing protein 34 [Scaptodrosophila lebanonensis]|uniref:Coiled-coil domain-containing protein 34 n=1 Tax=Drosophila lebanonensis TaxID=7225 RepID=A0A6J2TVK9_DROLE|nr:coiled-coil domain-containing protein 34 [Scaptodrosophila lebanonensis]
MAFSGHINATGQFEQDEVYSGRTRINRRDGDDQLALPIEEHNSEDSSSPPPATMDPSARTFVIRACDYIASRSLATVRYNGRSASNSEDSSPALSQDQSQSRSSGDESNTSSPHFWNNSNYSWTDMYGELKKSESQSNIVPSLDLGSDRTTISYLPDGAEVKVTREPEAAYENWYSAKQKLRQQQLQREKAERELKQQKAEERKRRAEESYQRWRREKAQVQQQNRGSPKPSLEIANIPKNARNVSPDKVKYVVDNWFMRKEQELEHRRELKRRQEQLEAEQRERRKHLAEMAWEKWMSTVYGKPKPVPLCQGMDSLRGTISALYINPESWVAPTDIVEQ